MSNLMDLKNIGSTSAHWLESVGIKDQKTLKEVGVIQAYLRIHQRGIKTSKVLLYALYGALHDLHWNEVPEDMKKELSLRIESALSQEKAEESF